MTDSPRINELIERLGEGDNPSHDGKVAGQLIEIGREATLHLIKALHHINPKVRSGAALILGTIADERVVEPLIAALNDNDSWTRMWAVISLGHLGDRRAIAPLLELLPENKAYSVAEALARFGDEEFIEPIIASLYLDAEKIMQQNNEDEEDEMYKNSRRADFFSRPHIRALTTFNDTRVIPPLIEALSSEDTKVFDPAFRHLKEIGADAVQPLLNAYHQQDADRSRIVWILGEIGDLRAFDLIVEALYDDDEAVQHDAIVALSDLKDSRAVPPLLEYLSHISPEDTWAITTTQKVLAELGYKDQDHNR